MHPLQAKIYQIYKNNNNALPPFRTLAKEIGVASLNTVSYHVNQLKKNGYFELSSQPNGIIKLSVKTILGLENQKGICVLLINDKPFHLFESEDIKSSLLEKISHPSEILEKIKSDPENTNIAYYIIDDADERTELKKHLLEYYKNQNISLLN